MRRESEFVRVACRGRRCGRSAAGVLLLVLLNAGTVAEAAAVRPGAAPTGFELRAGVVFDPSRAALYLMNAHGGIDAIDIRSGRLLWTATRAAKPLWVLDYLVIAQLNSDDRVLRMAMLDARRSGSVVRETAVELPQGVRTSIDEGLGISFETSARGSDGAVVVSWRFSRRSVS